jgi:hypothetical protein
MPASHRIPCCVLSDLPEKRSGLRRPLLAKQFPGNYFGFEVVLVLAAELFLAFLAAL